MLVFVIGTFHAYLSESIFVCVCVHYILCVRVCACVTHLFTYCMSDTDCSALATPIVCTDCMQVCPSYT